MEIVLEILRAFAPSMPIKHSKYLYLRPQLVIYLRLLELRLNHIQNNCYSIFICLPY